MFRIQWVITLTLLWGITGHAAAQGNQSAREQGERVFDKQCAGCHSVQAGVQRAGPSLYGVIGRSAGDLPGYEFSTVLRDADFVWTPEILDVFLQDPAAMLPGSFMVFWGLGVPQREQVIRYLESVSAEE
ncbi:cytochrome c family protein [Halomonas sp. QHL1]|uniref:c-type cytochrome n=1 Tax=Halomonas sp. QHL1 TaxID=1123773 RepID=UPI0008FD5366|nr:c-type cytochrome [Halomonas sp. QHL1]OJA04583.1 hypothetical protein QHL1GM_03825 [Halomonas sp. QHL1]